MLNEERARVGDADEHQEDSDDAAGDSDGDE
jgi:hypothetical protein